MDEPVGREGIENGLVDTEMRIGLIKKAELTYIHCHA